RKEACPFRLLVFRYPNNGSLARAGVFLDHEMRRGVVKPARAGFVCFSAGGLVGGYYAERPQGGVGPGGLLGAPNGGSRMASLKALLDAGEFFDLVKLGVPKAITKTLREGRGEIGHDLHPDSLFLRYLGGRPRDPKRYLLFSGSYLSRTEERAL